MLQIYEETPKRPTFELPSLPNSSSSLSLDSIDLTPSPATPSTPSRYLSVSEELCTESDEHAAEAVLRGLIRDVLRQEKDQLR